ncbi:hypothetical protein EG329_009168 [Mollisiaceae sp. DMI_Dod_QoI]|nr:hypothetical protein EG329_009168 [Helotiales sp. DMI_Dod_QoI]
MCIVLVTTAHPDYSLIVLDNRDEFVIRPTSRPHWWSSHHQHILSARDLQRAEKGTWTGITKTGNFAVLTNYRETNTHDTDHPVQGTRSRGGMVTAWLTAPNDESTHEFVHRLLEEEGVAGVGGFSLLCGKLRRRRDTKHELEPLAIISNRCDSSEDVPWIAGKREEVYGLSNTSYSDPDIWPKVQMGKEKVLQVVEDAVKSGAGEEELIEKLFTILDTDTLPEQNGLDFEAFIMELKKSIFIPSIGKEAEPRVPADAIAAADASLAEAELKEKERPDASPDMSGIYGTQRQTILLVDWEGNVTFTERSLWDDKGHPIPRGEADMTFHFKIDGWNGESKGNEVHALAVL